MRILDTEIGENCLVLSIGIAARNELFNGILDLFDSIRRSAVMAYKAGSLLLKFLNKIRLIR